MLYFLYIEAKQKSNRSIMTNFEKVGLFMKTFGQEVKITSSLSSEKINNLRISLINEELEEFKEAIRNNDLKELRSYFEKNFPSGSSFLIALNAVGAVNKDLIL